MEIYISLKIYVSMMLKNRIPSIYIFSNLHFYQRCLLYNVLLHTKNQNTG